jgi:uncharacterized protein YbjT (DUF2867 family)
MTGATGYLGRALMPALRARGHTVRALVRPGSAVQLAAGVANITGDALRAAGAKATILRPWYVLGPGHRGPSLLIPFYALAALVPRIRRCDRKTILANADRRYGPRPDVRSAAPSRRSTSRRLAPAVGSCCAAMESWQSAGGKDVASAEMALATQVDARNG